MGGESERRKHRRLHIRTDIFCRKIGSENFHNFTANTLNISTQGLLAESILHKEIRAGDLFNLELDLPEEDRTDLLGGKVSAYGKVVRIVETCEKTGRKHIAFQFCTRPQFEI
ncbi:MAG: PilZ domain protein [Planctomycetes bacterium ADurb.Bin401]|nr:MAG: PilZ domain protein [Planctomycetes bacterium ADurb.Bin401]